MEHECHTTEQDCKFSVVRYIVQTKTHHGLTRQMKRRHEPMLRLHWYPETVIIKRTS